MPEFKLKNGAIVKGTIEREEPHGYGLINVQVVNPDKSVTSYYRYWVNKADIAPEEKEEAKPEKVVEAEAPHPKGRGRRRKR